MTISTRNVRSGWSAAFSVALPTNAEWQQHLTDFFAVLTGAGLVRTADTGQIDVAAQVPPGNVTDYGTVRGYSMWRFADTLQATAPIFIKFIHISYASTVPNNGWAYNVQVGTGTDGAGNLTGNLHGATAPGNFGSPTQSSDNYDPTVRTWYASHGEGYFCLASHARTPQATYNGPAQGLVIIERSRGLNGAYDGEAVNCIYGGAMGNTNGQFASNVQLVAARPSTAATIVQNGRAVPQPWLSSGLNGSDVYLAPAVADLPWAKGAMKSMLGYTHADIGPLTPITVETGDGPLTYLPLGSCYGSAFAIGGTQSLVPAILWQ